MEAILFHGGSTSSALPWRISARVVQKAPPPPVLSFPTLVSALPRPLLCCARKRKSSPGPALTETPAERSEDALEGSAPPLDDGKSDDEFEYAELDDEFEDGEVDDEFDDDFDGEFSDNEILEDEDLDFEDDFEPEDGEPSVGDGDRGGGISLRGTNWDEEVLALAEKVSLSFGGDLKIYSFKTSTSSIKVSIEKLSNKSGSPSMNDIVAFAESYQSQLDEAVNAGRIPDNLSLEVSSPGVERVIRIPDDLERFKERPMYVRYMLDDETTGSPTHENEGIFRLVSLNPESASCVWGLADVRINREKAGKGRPLTKKLKEWRLHTRFESLRFVRIYSEC